MSNQQNPIDAGFAHDREMYETGPMAPAPSAPFDQNANANTVQNYGNVVTVGVDPMSRASANVMPKDDVVPSITWKDHVRGVEKEEIIIDKADDFDDSLRSLARERDVAIERAQACIDPVTGQVRPELAGDYARWTNRLAGLEHSIEYQLQVTQRERQKRYEREVGYVNEMLEDAKALDQRHAELTITQRRRERGY